MTKDVRFLNKTESISEVCIVDSENLTQGEQVADSAKLRYKFYFILILSLVIILIIIGIILLVHAASNVACPTFKSVESKLNICSESKEGKRIKLSQFMEKVKEEYYNVFPEEIAYYPGVTNQMIRDRYKPHDPRSENIKKITETAKALLKEARALNPQLSKLKPREHKLYLQTKHFLENTFGWPYLNYTSGLWLLGHTSFCYEPMCYVGYGINTAISRMNPSSKADVEQIIEQFKAINQTVYFYIDVLRMGIKRGMVRTLSECKAGTDGFKEAYSAISKRGSDGIRDEWYTKTFYSPSFYTKVDALLDEHFMNKLGLNVSGYVQSSLEKYVGKSLEYLIKYLEVTHYLYCRSNNAGSGGLSALPINVTYYNGSIQPNSTTYPYLPLCSGAQCKLDGKTAYKSILGYFTTKEIHPLEVIQLGWENLRILYPQAVEIAKNVTGFTNESTAIIAFKQTLKNLSLNYFNDKHLPENETKGDAFKKCSTKETAQKYCPERWKAMMKWFEFSQMTMSMLDPVTVDLFFFTGDYKTTPSCPIEMVPDFNPSSAAQSYSSSDASCTRPCSYYLPFFLENLGPKSSEYAINAHEARPGHHTQIQGAIENFQNTCGGVEAWLQKKNYYTAFDEGWALYAEYPLTTLGKNLYDNNPMQKYGMLNGQIWRALRLIVDAGMHYKGMSRDKALELFADYAWDTSDVTEKEVTRYQSNMGQATAYMIGQLDIWAVRNNTEKMLANKYNIKEFHHQILSQGSIPLPYLDSYMDKFIECKTNPKGQYCDIVLNPSKAHKNAPSLVTNSNIKWPVKRHYL